jgi:uncharacterized protein (DUF3084 family)
LEEQLKVVRGDCDNIAEERDSLILEVQHMRTDIEDTEEELDEASLPEEQ